MKMSLFYIKKPGSDLLSHGNSHTIIGAKSFHCPVRDGKEWDQVAMVVRLDGLVYWLGQ